VGLTKREIKIQFLNFFLVFVLVTKKNNCVMELNKLASELNGMSRGIFIK